MFEQEFFYTQSGQPVDLASELDVVSWSDLARHFAFGRLYVVREPWSILEAAHIIKDDNAERLKAAMDKGEFGAPTPEEATLWHEAKQQFDVLVLDPFVLVSPKK